jgi:hypothetical protein
MVTPWYRPDTIQETVDRIDGIEPTTEPVRD